MSPYQIQLPVLLGPSPAEVVILNCPSCNESHSINVGRGGVGWNGDRVRPTFYSTITDRDCLFSVTDGKIEFHSGPMGGSVIPLSPNV